MSRRKELLALTLLFSPVIVGRTSVTPSSHGVDLRSYGARIKPSRQDAVIEQLLQKVSEAEVRHTVESLVSFGNRNTLGGMEGNTGKNGVASAADWIEQQFKTYSIACGGCLEVKRDTWTEQPKSRIPKPAQLTNVYAILRGTDASQADRVNLVTGHYDSRNTDLLDTQGPAPGANDDGSGVAVSLECARVLSMRKWPSTLVFAAVTGEEQGLDGSRHLAVVAKQSGWQIEGVLNNDIVGGNTTPGDRLQDKSLLRVFSEGIPANVPPDRLKRINSLGAESDSPSRELARAVAEVARAYTSEPRSVNFHAILELRRDRYLRGGDHTSFNAEGYPAVRLTEWREDFNHQHQNLRTENGIVYGDLLQFVDFSYVRNVARLNSAVLASLASAPGKPQNVQLATKALDNNSTLQWQAPANAPPDTTYEIVWRETAIADWQFFANAGTTTDITLPISKDNVILGVRSVDAAGHRSPAGVPE